MIMKMALGAGHDNDINGIADDRLTSGRPQGAENVAGIKSWVWLEPNTPPPPPPPPPNTPPPSPFLPPPLL